MKYKNLLALISYSLICTPNLNALLWGTNGFLNKFAAHKAFEGKDYKKAQTILEKQQVEQQTEIQLIKLRERLNAKEAAQIKAEQEKESLQFKNRLGIAFIVSLLIIGSFRAAFNYFKWPWLLNHENAIALEVGFALLIGCIILPVAWQLYLKNALKDLSFL